MASTPQSRKAKGRRLQQMVRDMILSKGQGLTEDDVRSTSMGANGADVLLSQAALKQFPLSIECKNLAAFVGYTYLGQAEANARPNQQPVAVVKKNLKKPVVVVDADYFFDLVAKVNGKKK